MSGGWIGLTDRDVRCIEGVGFWGRDVLMFQRGEERGGVFR